MGQLPPVEGESAGVDALAATKALEAAETIPELRAAFAALSRAGRSVDWGKVSAMKAQAKEEEGRRPGAKAAGAGSGTGPSGMAMGGGPGM